MKKTLLLSLLLSTAPVAAFAADLAVEPAAAPVVATASQYSGYVAVNAQATNWQSYDDEFDSDYSPWKGLGAEAALAYWLDDKLQVELEARTWSTQDNYYDGYYSTYQSLAALHLNYSFGDASLGAFVGATSFNEYYEDGTDYGVLGGIEGQIAVTDNLILNGQVGVVKSVSGYYQDDYPLTAGFAQAGVKYFPLDNLGISAYVGFVKGDYDDSSDEFSTVTYGAQIEYQFENTPFSVFAAYEGYKDNADWADSTDTVKIGAKFSFDGESLKQQAKTGASHNVANLDSISWQRYYY